MDTIATWLTTQLQQLDLNALGLAYATEVSHVTVGKWLKGTYIPNPANCRKLARVFNVPEDDLLIIAGHRSPPANDNQVCEPRAAYHTGPRAQLLRLLDSLTDEQTRIFIDFLKVLGKS